MPLSPDEVEVPEGIEVSSRQFAGMPLIKGTREDEPVWVTECDGEVLEASTVGELVEAYGQAMQEDDA